MATWWLLIGNMGVKDGSAWIWKQYGVNWSEIGNAVSLVLHISLCLETTYFTLLKETSALIQRSL